MQLVFDRTPLLLCLLCLYYAYYTCIMPTMPVLCVLCLYYAYYACTMPTMPVLCLLCLYYAYYACTMPTMPVLCLLCLFITTVRWGAILSNTSKIVALGKSEKHPFTFNKTNRQWLFCRRRQFTLRDYFAVSCL